MCFRCWTLESSWLYRMSSQRKSGVQVWCGDSSWPGQWQEPYREQELLLSTVLKFSFRFGQPFIWLKLYCFYQLLLYQINSAEINKYGVCSSVVKSTILIMKGLWSEGIFNRSMAPEVWVCLVVCGEWCRKEDWGPFGEATASMSSKLHRSQLSNSWLMSR